MIHHRIIDDSLGSNFKDKLKPNIHKPTIRINYPNHWSGVFFSFSRRSKETANSSKREVSALRMLITWEESITIAFGEEVAFWIARRNASVPSMAVLLV